MKEITPEELAEADGKNGKPVYVAHGNRVFDVSGSRLWTGGFHMQRHHGGADLTADISAAPHGPEMLDRYPQVGTLKKGQESERQVPPSLSRLLRQYPVLKRHPHPMTVHFPIVFMFSAGLFTLLFLFTRVPGFEVTALNCLGAGLAFTPVAMATGYYTWWLNYRARPMRPVAIKQRLSMALLGVNIVVLVWRVAVPDILLDLRFSSGIYLILVFSLSAMVSVIGWFGASLTFPVEKE